MVFVFIEILFKILLFKGGVLIYAEHCIYNIYMYIYYYYINAYQFQSRANDCTSKEAELSS